MLYVKISVLKKTVVFLPFRHRLNLRTSFKVTCYYSAVFSDFCSHQFNR